MLRAKPTLTEAAGVLIALVTLGGVTYLAVVGVEQAQGALYTVLAAAAGYVYRGKVERPSEPPPLPAPGAA